MEEIHAVRCIWCGREMERGTLVNQCARAIFLPTGTSIPRFYTQKALDKRNCIPLTPLNEAPHAPEEFPTAYVCRNCRKIVIPY
ncbi:MAG TPA: hypothetical protein IAC31_00030 [Candidatus Faecousia intestinigallinarum]|nr:hypothetical protein [Candidatus Faecousia intestinigallinarum]